MVFWTTFLEICMILWFGAISYIIITALRHPAEFKEAINSILNDLLDV